MRTLTGDRAAFDFVAALTVHGVFSRHPRLKVAMIESGCEWLFPLVRKMKKAYAQQPFAFTSDPIEQLREHLWVAPFYEDDIRTLADVLGVDHVLFGSDFPHAEGLAEPLSFANDLHAFTDDEIQMVMSRNARTLLAA